jgi:hypothetical protein
MAFPAYHLHKAPVQLETLSVVQYLHSLGIDARPALVVERCHAPEASELPSIWDVRGGAWHVGLAACAEFYSRASGVADVLSRARAFTAANPGYRVGAQSSQVCALEARPLRTLAGGDIPGCIQGEPTCRAGAFASTAHGPARQGAGECGW